VTDAGMMKWMKMTFARKSALKEEATDTGTGGITNLEKMDASSP